MMQETVPLRVVHLFVDQLVLQIAQCLEEDTELQGLEHRMNEALAFAPFDNLLGDPVVQANMAPLLERLGVAVAAELLARRERRTRTTLEELVQRVHRRHEQLEPE